ncbi:MAG: type II secretion system protein [bacterium]
MKKGFTLIELLVVIAIIGILSAIGLVSLNGAREKARDAQAKSDIGQMRTALTLYADDNGGGYPGQRGVLAANCVNADGTLTVHGIWGNVDAAGDNDFGVIVPDYLGSGLEAPVTPTATRDYFYCANNVFGSDATEYVLFYMLETGTGNVYYSLLEDGTVEDYSDGDMVIPTCGAVAAATCSA